MLCPLWRGRGAAVYLAGARLGCSVSPLITSWTQALPTAPTSDPTPCRCRSGEHVPGAGAETRAPCRVARSCPTPADRHCCTRAGRAGPFHLTVGERTFAYPASPWLPKKGSDLSVHSGEELQRVQDRLNHRPRKTLDQQTPAEVFDANPVWQGWTTGGRLAPCHNVDG
jgi:hypothetical protein